MLYTTQRHNRIQEINKQAISYAKSAIVSIESIVASLENQDPGCQTLDASEYITRLSILIGQLRTYRNIESGE